MMGIQAVLLQEGLPQPLHWISGYWAGYGGQEEALWFHFLEVSDVDIKNNVIYK